MSKTIIKTNAKTLKYDGANISIDEDTWKKITIKADGSDTFEKALNKICIYPRALTEEEIRKSYAGKKLITVYFISEDGKSITFHFDDGSFTVINYDNTKHWIDATYEYLLKIYELINEHGNDKMKEETRQEILRRLTKTGIFDLHQPPNEEEIDYILKHL
jgi:hypothetical protein